MSADTRDEVAEVQREHYATIHPTGSGREMCSVECLADALLASDWLARLKAEARADGAASAMWVALQLRAALAARSDQGGAS